MLVPKWNTILVLSAAIAILVGFSGCDAMDSLLSSAGTYKVNAEVNSVPLNECSFIASHDKIFPFFEESVAKDPDITSLIISIRSPGEDVSEWRAVYSLKKETEIYNRAVQVEKLDDLPSFSLPQDLPGGFYSMVFQIMGGKDILQRTEKDFYYLGDTSFIYDGIDVHLPGISENPLLISKGQVVMLEAKLDFDKSLDPYIVWYNGRVRLSEGKYSEGMGCMFWKAPEQSNFYSLRAEVFPVREHDNLAGYKRSVSVLVSSNTVDVNLVSGKAQELRHWYVFENNLNDSVLSIDEQRSLRTADNRRAKWMPVNGTYGLATGVNNLFSLPIVPFAASDSWQFLFRFKPVNDGSFLAVNFNANNNVVMDLSIIEEKLILTLSSSFNTVSHSYNLPSGIKTKDFYTMGLNVFTAPRQILAKVNILDQIQEQDEFLKSHVSMEAVGVSDFQVILGNVPKREEERADYIAADFTAVWDEFALYNNPSMDVIAAEINFNSENLISLYE